MTTPSIQIATASDEAPAIAVVVLAFSADPVVRWTWPEPQQYLRHFPHFVQAFGGQAFAHRSAYYKVYGVENLRIADGSIMPRVTTGNTMAPCVIIGERAAEILKAKHKL
jgi:hypothetical protein